MDIVQQQMLDSYRAAQHGEPPPPPPGRHDREVFRDLRRRFGARAAGPPGQAGRSRPGSDDGTTTWRPR